MFDQPFFIFHFFNSEVCAMYYNSSSALLLPTPPSLYVQYNIEKQWTVGGATRVKSSCSEHGRRRGGREREEFASWEKLFETYSLFSFLSLLLIHTYIHTLLSSLLVGIRSWGPFKAVTLAPRGERPLCFRIYIYLALFLNSLLLD